MKTAYVLGPITQHGKEYLPVYKAAMKVCSNHFDSVIGSYPDFWKMKEKPENYYSKIMKEIKNCSMLVAEVSKASHGVGIELQASAESNIPLICLAEKGIIVSSMIRGLPNLKAIVYYDDLQNLEEKLNDKFQHLLF